MKISHKQIESLKQQLADISKHDFKSLSEFEAHIILMTTLLIEVVETLSGGLEDIGEHSHHIALIARKTLEKVWGKDNEMHK